MRTYLFAAILMWTSACGAGDAPSSTRHEEPTQTPVMASSQPAPLSAQPKDESRAALKSSADAADVVRLYYTLIGERRFGEAWALRQNDSLSAAQFAQSYGRYRTYRATVGTPSDPQRAGAFEFVEVPVQLYGQMANGRPFGSAGTITLRRHLKSSGARQGWRIYTSD